MAALFPRLPCSSPCAPGDSRCQAVEALFQHVLGYPRLPTRVCAYLPRLKASVPAMSATIRGLAAHYGAELTLLLLRRAPFILEHDMGTLVGELAGVGQS
jgi:hypothetical protein